MLRRLAALSCVLSLAACGGGVGIEIGGGGGGDGPRYPQPNPNPNPATLSCSPAGLAASAASAWGTVCMLTSSGEIVVELYDSYAPQTVANFYRYVSAGFYTNTLIHRVDRDFVIQGGGYSPAMVAKTPLYAPIKLESDNGLSNLRGTLAMARRSDADSATSQFFFNVSDNAFLDHKSKSGAEWGYTVFGKVVSGMDVVDAIKAVKTGAKGAFSKDAPLETVSIVEVRRA